MHFLKICVFLGLVLVILWLKVMNNYGVPKIFVFLGWILVILWPKVTNNYGVLEIHVFLGRILVIFWPKVMNNYVILEICVFLHPETLEFHVVGELSCWGHKLEIDVLNFVPFCYWKGVKFM